MKKTVSKILFVLVAALILFAVLGKSGFLGEGLMKVAENRPWWKIAIWIFILPFAWSTGFGSVETTADSTDDPTDDSTLDEN